MWGCGGGDSAAQSHSMSGVRGAEQYTRAHRGTHTHTEELTRGNRCTYPSATYPLKSGRVNLKRHKHHNHHKATPDIPQSEIAAANVFYRANWAKFWTKISGHFRASFTVQNGPPKFLPKSLPIYHSMSCHGSCDWNLKNSSPRASGAWGAQHKASYVPRAQHINFGRSHPPRKIVPKCPFGIPRMNFPEFPGSAFFLALLYYLIGNPEFPGIFGISPERFFGIPESRFRGKMELILARFKGQLGEDFMTVSIFLSFAQESQTGT